MRDLVVVAGRLVEEHPVARQVPICKVEEVQGQRGQAGVDAHVRADRAVGPQQPPPGSVRTNSRARHRVSSRAISRPRASCSSLWSQPLMSWTSPMSSSSTTVCRARAFCAFASARFFRRSRRWRSWSSSRACRCSWNRFTLPGASRCLVAMPRPLRSWCFSTRGSRGSRRSRRSPGAGAGRGAGPVLLAVVLLALLLLQVVQALPVVLGDVRHMIILGGPSSSTNVPSGFICSSPKAACLRNAAVARVWAASFAGR